MTISNIRSALIQAIENLNLALPTAHENVTFTPPENQPWLAVFFLPNQPEVHTLGTQGQDMITGILQVDTYYPVGVGSKDQFDLIDQIRSAFPAGSKPSYSGQEVVVRSCGRGPGLVEGSFYRIPVTVYWYAHLNRN